MAPDLRPIRPRRRTLRRLACLTALAAGCWLTGAGCRTAAAPPPPGLAELAGAVEALGRPLPGDMAALYQLRVPSSGGLRLSIVGSAVGGRMTISEPFGAAISITSWSAAGPVRVFDMRHGCRLEQADASAALGVAAMPLPEAVRLLGGRLPAVDGDRVRVRSGGRLEIVGADWSAVVLVAPDPWRVTEVEELTRAGRDGWRVRLGDHTASVPGSIRIQGPDRGWAQLELIRLEWDGGRGLPPEPALPTCVGVTEDIS